MLFSQTVLLKKKLYIYWLSWMLRSHTEVTFWSSSWSTFHNFISRPIFCTKWERSSEPCLREWVIATWPGTGEVVGEGEDSWRELPQLPLGVGEAWGDSGGGELICSLRDCIKVEEVELKGQMEQGTKMNSRRVSKESEKWKREDAELVVYDKVEKTNKFNHLPKYWDIMCATKELDTFSKSYLCSSPTKKQYGTWPFLWICSRSVSVKLLQFKLQV